MRRNRLLMSLAAASLALAVTGSARADEAVVSQPQMQAAVRSYYGTEMTTGFLFMTYGRSRRERGVWSSPRAVILRVASEPLP